MILCGSGLYVVEQVYEWLVDVEDFWLVFQLQLVLFGVIMVYCCYCLYVDDGGMVDLMEVLWIQYFQ